jgi:hypothetical protein
MNNELDELIKHGNIINSVKSQRLSWAGHINRMPGTGIVRKIYKWKPFTSRPVGSPKSRWEDDVRNHLKKIEAVRSRFEPGNRLPRDVMGLFKTDIYCV